MPPRLLENMPASFMSRSICRPSRRPSPATCCSTFPNLTVVDISGDLPAGAGRDRPGDRRGRVSVPFTLVAGRAGAVCRAGGSAATSACAKPACCARWARRASSCRGRRWPRCCVSADWPGCWRRSARAAIGWALAGYAFEFDYVVTPWVFVVGIVGGAVCALTGGWIGLRSVLKTPPLTTLREA